jgi:hypothetical protein
MNRYEFVFYYMNSFLCADAQEIYLTIIRNKIRKLPLILIDNLQILFADYVLIVL